MTSIRSSVRTSTPRVAGGRLRGSRRPARRPGHRPATAAAIATRPAATSSAKVFIRNEAAGPPRGTKAGAGTAPPRRRRAGKPPCQAAGARRRIYHGRCATPRIRYSGHMPGRPWSLEEDDAIRAACVANRVTGLTDMDGATRNPRWRARRLQTGADRFGRTLAAVRKRAQRIGERSYRPSWTRAVSVAAGRQAERQFSRLRATDQRAATEGRRRHHQGGGEAAAGRHAGGAGFPSGGVR